ncbi:MAG: response regulator [Chitinophagaceae bacterium]
MPKKKILLIEDNDEIRDNTAEILELSNYQVIVAENGKRGVEQALEHTPDLIICDIMMPGLDGYGVLHAVHKNNAIRNIPFIFLTAKTERGDFRKGMELGADDYITKPFDGTELLNAVDSRLKKMDLLKQEMVSGPEGVQHLMSVSSGKNVLQSFTEERNTNAYKKKQRIYSEGNHPHGLFFVRSGKVKTYKTNDNGKELVTDLFNAGDFLGYIALLQDSVYRDTAEALEETELAVIPKEDFMDLIHNNTAIAQKFIRMLAGNVVEKEDQLLGLAYNSLRKKVADAILLLQKKYGDNKNNTFQIDISRENLATIAGTATESLIRTLSDFRIEKLIELKDGVITISNQQKLENLLN